MSENKLKASRGARGGVAVLIIWIAGFIVGTVSHVLELVDGGLDTYGEYPTALRLFWVSLTVLDPITVLLLALRRRAGIVLALIVILVDFGVNWTVFAMFPGIPVTGVVNLTVFTGFLLATAPFLWRWFSRPADAAGHGVSRK